MSIILKGIDLPKEGRLKLEITSDGLVWIDKGKEFYAHKDYASQIPTPHGRLIDGDKILSPIMCRPKSLRLDDNAQYNIITLIADAPTILEAEGETAYTIQADSDTVSFKNNGENQF